MRAGRDTVFTLIVIGFADTGDGVGGEGNLTLEGLECAEAAMYKDAEATVFVLEISFWKINFYKSFTQCKTTKISVCAYSDLSLLLRAQTVYKFVCQAIGCQV